MTELALHERTAAPFAYREEPQAQDFHGADPQIVRVDQKPSGWPHSGFQSSAWGSYTEIEDLPAPIDGLVEAARAINRIVVAHTARSGNEVDASPRQFRLGQTAIAILREGFRSIVEEEHLTRGVDLNRDAAYLNDEDISRFGADIIDAQLASLALDFGFLHKSLVITNESGFRSSVERAFLKDLPHLVRSGGRLLDAVRTDLTEHLSAGGYIGGEWGQLALRASHLYMDIAYTSTNEIVKIRRTSGGVE